MSIFDRFTEKGGPKKAELSGTQISKGGKMVYASQMERDTSNKIIAEQIEQGLKTNEMELRERGAAAAKKILLYLSERYEMEDRDLARLSGAVSPKKKNMELFKFATKGLGTDNLLLISRFLKEKAGFEIDFSDPYIMTIGNEVMGKEDFKRYLSLLAVEVGKETELKEEDKKSEPAE